MLKLRENALARPNVATVALTLAKTRLIVKKSHNSRRLPRGLHLGYQFLCPFGKHVEVACFNEAIIHQRAPHP